jgi:hypothetical protein
VQRLTAGMAQMPVAGQGHKSVTKRAECPSSMLRTTDEICGYLDGWDFMQGGFTFIMTSKKRLNAELGHVTKILLVK